MKEWMQLCFLSASLLLSPLSHRKMNCTVQDGKELLISILLIGLFLDDCMSHPLYLRMLASAECCLYLIKHETCSF